MYIVTLITASGLLGAGTAIACWKTIEDTPCGAGAVDPAYGRSKEGYLRCSANMQSVLRCDGQFWRSEGDCPGRCIKTSKPGKIHCVDGLPIKGFNDLLGWSCDPASDGLRKCDENQPYVWICAPVENKPYTHEWTAPASCSGVFDESPQKKCFDHHADGSRMKDASDPDEFGILCAEKL